MPVCRVEDAASPTFARLVKKLTKKFPRIADDLADAYAEIEADYSTACHANAIPGYDRAVWKYRFPSRDAARGRRGGFRLIAHVDAAAQVLRPVMVFFKGDQEDADAAALRRALKEMLDGSGNAGGE